MKTKTAEDRRKSGCRLCERIITSDDDSTVHRVLSHGQSYCGKCDSLFDSCKEKTLHDDFLHVNFSCSKCHVKFSDVNILKEHLSETHKAVQCKYCSKILSNSCLTDHMIKVHNLPASVSETEAPLITHGSTGAGASSSTYTCNPCKLQCTDFSHLLEHHALSKLSIIEMWAETEPSSTSDQTIQLISPEPNCSLCSTQQKDAGLHLVLKHGMKRCPDPSCRRFIPPTSDLCHVTVPTPTCTKCSYIPSSMYSLVVHASEEHSTQICILCSNKEYNNVDSLVNHLSQDHCINNRDILVNSCNPPILALVNSNLATFKQKAEILECHLCKENLENRFIDCSSDYGHILQHMKEFHNISVADTLLLDIYEEGAFAYKNLKQEQEEICHDSLVNLNPVKSNPQSNQCSQSNQHPCIICGKGFSNSEEVQVHLLADHITANIPLADQQQSIKNTLETTNPKETLERTNPPSHTESVNPPNTPGKILESVKFAEKTPERTGLFSTILHVSPSDLESKVDLTQLNSQSSSSENESPRELKTPSRQEDVPGSEDIRPIKSNRKIIVTTAPRRKRIKLEVKEEETVDPVVQNNVDTTDQPVALKKEQEDPREEVDSAVVNVDESDLEIDEEHFSINHVEVCINTAEEENEELEEKDYCPVIDTNMIIDQKIDDCSAPPEEDKEEEGKDSVRIVGNIGKNPVFVKCDLCGVILASIMNFTSHMKKEHKDSELERNKPFRCDLCSQGFYFQSSLNSHRSKAHHEVVGEKYTCTLCPSVTNSKNGMRRHMTKSHGKILEDYLCYSCEFCSQTFTSIALKKNHIVENHKECVNVEKCFVCQHISPNKTALRRHFLRMHPNEPLFENVSYKCGLCDLLFPQKSLLSNHIKAEHPKSVLFQCAYCLSQFSSKKILSAHVAKHKENSSAKFRCSECGRQFFSSRALKCHTATMHLTLRSNNSTTPPKTTCKKCDMSFESPSEKQAHMREVHPSDRPYVCEECDFSFTSKSGLYNHKSVHRKCGLFDCSTCGKVFTRRDTFKEHILIHNGPRHKCPHCPKDFVQRSNLKRHIRIHLGIKPYKCPLCDSTFSDKGACNSHIKTHTGEEREACEICGLIFSKKQKLKYHMRSHTGEGLKSCVICDKSFTHSYALNSHIKIHQKDKQYMCYVCKRLGIQTKGELYRHLESHSTDDFECSQCGRSFKFFKLLQRHVQAVHQQVKGFECSAETCGYRTAFVNRIRTHVQDSHSIKNPQCPVHFVDHFNENIDQDPKGNNHHLEVDIYAIYECLDEIVDTAVMGELDFDYVVKLEAGEADPVEVEADDNNDDVTMKDDDVIRKEMSRRSSSDNVTSKSSVDDVTRKEAITGSSADDVTRKEVGGKVTKKKMRSRCAADDVTRKKVRSKYTENTKRTPGKNKGAKKKVLKQ